MKKLVALLLCGVIALAGCKATTTPGEPTASSAPSQKEVGTVADYFPFEADTLYTYEANASSGLGPTAIFNTYLEGNRAQRCISRDGFYATEMIERTKDQATLVFGDSQHAFYDNILAAEPTMELVLLKGPLKLGQTWQAAEDQTSEITSVDTTISTPAGDFTTIEVTTTFESGSVEKYYYAKDIGLVQSVFTASIGEVVTTLSSIQKDQTMEAKLNVELANVTINAQEPTPTTLALPTNPDLPKLIEGSLKQVPSDDYLPLISEDTIIKSITIDWPSSLATVDLSKHYVKDVNVGDGIQRLLLQCLVDTIGKFYDVQRVMVTIEGKPFENGSISLKDGEGLPVTQPETEQAPGEGTDNDASPEKR